MQSVWRLRRTALLAAMLIAALMLAVPAVSQAGNGRLLLHGHPIYQLRVDPLKGFGQNPFGHLHNYCGADAPFGANMTLAQMYHATSTSFNVKSDKSGLWYPAPLEADGVTPVPLANQTCAYYLTNRGYNLTEDPPNGLRFVGGNPDCTGIGCGVGYFGSGCSWFQHTIPSTTSGCSGYEEEIDTYQQCWDGQHLGKGMGSADTAATFLTGSAAGAGCTNGYPVPEIDFVLFVGSAGDGGCLSSDVDLGTCRSSPGASGHFDYVFNWGQDTTGLPSLGKIIHSCENGTVNSAGTSCYEFKDSTGGFSVETVNYAYVTN